MSVSSLFISIWFTWAAYSIPFHDAEKTVSGWWRYVGTAGSDWDPAGFLALLAAIALPLFLATSVERRMADRTEEESARTIGLELVTLLACIVSATLAWSCLPAAAHGAGFPLVNGSGCAGAALLFATLAALAAPSDALARRSRLKRERDLALLRRGAGSLRAYLRVDPFTGAKGTQGVRPIWLALSVAAWLSASIVALGTTAAFYVHPHARVIIWLIGLLAVWQFASVLTFVNQHAHRQVLHVTGRRLAGATFLVMASLVTILFFSVAAWQSLEGYWFISAFLLLNEIVAPWFTYRWLRRSKLAVRLTLHKIERRCISLEAAEEPDHPLLALG